MRIRKLQKTSTDKFEAKTNWVNKTAVITDTDAIKRENTQITITKLNYHC